MKVIISTAGVSLIRNNIQNNGEKQISNLFGRPVSEWEEHRAYLVPLQATLILFCSFKMAS